MLELEQAVQLAPSAAKDICQPPNPVIGGVGQENPLGFGPARPNATEPYSDVLPQPLSGNEPRRGCVLRAVTRLSASAARSKRWRVSQGQRIRFGHILGHYVTVYSQ